jgi:hypothetical protein
LFFETINAAGVLQVPMVMSVWDDEYEFLQSTKQPKKIFQRLKGYQREDGTNGYEILRVKGWDYSIASYDKAAAIAFALF